jgi:hypothetical protein
VNELNLPPTATQTTEKISFDKPPPIRFNIVVKMNTMFTKLMKTHAPVTGCMAIWQRTSRRFGVVGLKS